MTSRPTLTVAIGQHSERGRKAENQDFHGVCVPGEPQLGSKGVAVALADGISSSEVGRAASEAAVHSFLDDYYCTSDAWSVKTAGTRVLAAANSWLHAQTRRSDQRYEKDRGYVCTFSALVFKARAVHLFHVGDARIYRVRGRSLEQLTTDHRVTLSSEESYLGRALGVEPHVEIDYQSFPVEVGDTFMLATDGVYEHVSAAEVADALAAHAGDLDAAARAIVQTAFDNGSPDNLTAQLARVTALPERTATEVHQQLGELPLPPLLEPRMVFDGFRIVRELHASSRSHIYLAEDADTGQPVVIKIPSIDLRGDAAYLERFMLEQWVAQRIDSAHVLKPYRATRARNFLYVVMEFVDGQTLTQWMIDNPRASLETVRGIVEQIARGLLAFHRLEMLHRDLRPENIMIDRTGTVKIIDFGSTLVPGMQESGMVEPEEFALGTPQYTAPEYFLGEPAGTRADLFSLGVITYQMLTGSLPYGADVARARTRSAMNRLAYRTALADDRELPAWVDAALARAVHINPLKRHTELSEFLADLRRPNSEFARRAAPALIDTNPVAFWRGVSLVLAIVVVILLGVMQFHGR